MTRRTMSLMSGPENFSSSIRTAMIGYGLAGRVFHCPFIAAVPGLQLRSIVQRHGEEARSAYPAAHIARTVDEVLHDSSIDLVVVATPNETHFELARRVLMAGKHCVVDKPFAATSDEAIALLKLAKDKGSFIFPFHNRRFDGDFLTLKKILEDGTLGRVVEISSRFDRFRPRVRDNTWKELKGPMNGVLFDLGSHLIDQALALFGKPDAVKARMYRDREGTEIDDAFELTLEYRALGLRYRCASTLLAADPAPRFRVNGTRGSYVKYGVDPQEAAVGAGIWPPLVGAPGAWLPEPEDAWGTTTLADEGSTPPKLTKASHPTLSGDYRTFYENVRDTIHGTAEPALRPEDGYRCIRLLELAMESHSQQRTVPVELKF